MLLDDGLNLGDQSGVNELGQIDASDVVDKTEVHLVESQGAKVKSTKDSKLLKLDKVLNLLKLEETVDIEYIVGEQAREPVNVEVVDSSELLQDVEVKRVDDTQVVDIQAIEAEVVEQGSINNPASLLLLGRGSRGDGSEAGNEDSGELHVD